MQKSVVIFALAILTIALAGCNEVKDNINMDIYRELPKMPEDLFLIVREVTDGQYPDMCDITEEYYKRPEFYPRWEQHKKTFYDNHDYSVWGVYGYGAYPADISYALANVKKGDTIEFCTFFKTAWSIETYQGIELVPIEDEYWDVSLNPSIFMAMPTFPVFNKEWSKKIELKLTAKKDIPPNTYQLGFAVTSPSQSIEKEFKRQLLDMPIKQEYLKLCKLHLDDSKLLDENRCQELFEGRTNNYVNGAAWSIGKTIFNLEVVVIE